MAKKKKKTDIDVGVIVPRWARIFKEPDYSSHSRRLLSAALAALVVAAVALARWNQGTSIDALKEGALQAIFPLVILWLIFYDMINISLHKLGVDEVSQELEVYGGEAPGGEPLSTEVKLVGYGIFFAASLFMLSRMFPAP